MPILLGRSVEKATIVCAPAHRLRCHYFFGGVYPRFGVRCTYRSPRLRPSAAALAWEAAALTVMRRQRRAAVEELERRGNSLRSAERRADSGSVHRRRLSLFLAFCLLTVALVAGCGGVSSPNSSSAEPAAADAPSGADLAADAFDAVKEPGAAISCFDATVNASGPAAAMAGDGPVKLQLEGDASADELALDVKLDFSGQSFAAVVLANRKELFIRFLNRWYGERDLKLPKQSEEERDRFEQDFGTPEGLRANFDQVFTGTVLAGPVVDGVETWEFRGSLNVDGILALAEEYGGEAMKPEERAKFESLAEVVHFRFTAGRDDHLPRSYSMDVELDGSDLNELGQSDSLDSVDLHIAVKLSDFGKDVSYERPAEYEPLEKLFESLFSGIG